MFCEKKNKYGRQIPEIRLCATLSTQHKECKHSLHGIKRSYIWILPYQHICFQLLRATMDPTFWRRECLGTGMAAWTGPPQSLEKRCSPPTWDPPLWTTCHPPWSWVPMNWSCLNLPWLFCQPQMIRDPDQCNENATAKLADGLEMVVVVGVQIANLVSRRMRSSSDGARRFGQPGLFQNLQERKQLKGIWDSAKKESSANHPGVVFASWRKRGAVWCALLGCRSRSCRGRQAAWICW